MLAATLATTACEDDGWWGTMGLDRSAQQATHMPGLLAGGKVFGSSER